MWIVAFVSFFAPAASSANVFSSSLSFSSNAFLDPFAPPGQPSYEIQTWSLPNETGGSHCFLDLTIKSNLVLSPYDATIGQIWYAITNGAVVSPATQSSLPLLMEWVLPGPS